MIIFDYFDYSGLSPPQAGSAVTGFRAQVTPLLRNSLRLPLHCLTQTECSIFCSPEKKGKREESETTSTEAECFFFHIRRLFYIIYYSFGSQKNPCFIIEFLHTTFKLIIEIWVFSITGISFSKFEVHYIFFILKMFNC